MPPDSRERLAHSQSQMVAALMMGKPVPTGFNVDDVASAAHSLLMKRYRIIQTSWPVFDQILDQQFAPLFAEYARQSPLPIKSQARQDGCQFARWLLKRRQLPDQCRLALLHAELQGVAKPRRGLCILFAWLRERRQIAFGIKIPGRPPWVLPKT